MYKDAETETSYKYLKIVISELKEPICILGGWAVFFTVNKNYQKLALRVYIGSRGIDVTALCLFSGAHIDGIIKAGKSFVTKEKLKKFSNMDFSDDIKNCSNTLGLESGVVKSVINKIKEN